MPVAIEFFLDERSADVVRRIWRQIAEAGISSHLHTSGVRPHLTLAASDAVGDPAVEAALREWAAATQPRALTFNGVGLSTSDPANVFLTPIITADLLALHQELHHRIEGYLVEPWARYLPRRWTPHCTLIERVPASQLAQTIEIARAAPLPLEARLIALALVEFRPFRLRTTFPLEGQRNAGEDPIGRFDQGQQAR